MTAILDFMNGNKLDERSSVEINKSLTDRTFFTSDAQFNNIDRAIPDSMPI